MGKLLMLLGQNSSITLKVMLCDIFIFSITSVLVLGSIQAPVHWALGTHSSGIKWPGPEAHHSSASSSEVTNEQSHTSHSLLYVLMIYSGTNLCLPCVRCCSLDFCCSVLHRV